MEERRVIEISLLQDEGPPDMVIGQVPKVFGGKGQRIDRPIVGMMVLNDLLFDTPHDSASGCSSSLARMVPMSSWCSACSTSSGPENASSPGAEQTTSPLHFFRNKQETERATLKDEDQRGSGIAAFLINGSKTSPIGQKKPHGASPSYSGR
jgi:hypothetical protein